MHWNRGLLHLSLMPTELLESCSNMCKGRTTTGVANPAILDERFDQSSEARGGYLCTFVLVCGYVINVWVAVGQVHTQDEKSDEVVVAMAVWKVTHSKNLDAADGKCIYIRSRRQRRCPIQKLWRLPP